MTQYELREDGQTFSAVDAESAEQALATLEGELSWSDYCDGDEEPATTFARIYAVNPDDADDSAGRTFKLEPPEPDCPDHDEHDWQSPHAIVGGIAENPGVHGSGGGVVISECCMHCGCRRTTDTWATDPTNGTQGHTTICYSPGFYSDELSDDDARGEADDADAEEES